LGHDGANSQGVTDVKVSVWEASPTPMLLRFANGPVADSEIAVRDGSHRVFVKNPSPKSQPPNDFGTKARFL
jgi:hypothetical protein